MKLSQRGVIHTLPLLVIIAAIGIISFLLITSTAPLSRGLFQTLNPKSQSHAMTMDDMNQCMFLSAPGTTPAFCDTFSMPMPGGRGGDLDETKWEFAHVNQAGMTYTPGKAQFCKDVISGVLPDKDSFICGEQYGEPNHWMETIEDGGGYVYNNAKIRQPFDFTNRTGTITFNVDAKTDGEHTWWPEVWITDQPVIGPHHVAAGVDNVPRNGIGILFGDATCPSQAPQISSISDYTTVGKGAVSDVHIVENYQDYQLVGGDINAPTFTCYTTQTDNPNHMEIRLSPTFLEIWVSDAGGANFHLNNRVNFASALPKQGLPATLPFSRGWVSFDHAHYNAEKEGVSSAMTYHWHAIGFDGPYLGNLRGYDVPDSLSMHSDGRESVDYIVKTDGTHDPVTNALKAPFTLQNVDNSGISEGHLNFVWQCYDGIAGLQYRFNGGTWRDITTPLPSEWSTHTPCPPYQSYTISVVLSDLKSGTNTLEFKKPSSDANNSGGSISNIGLELTPTSIGTPPPISTPKPPAPLQGTQYVSDVDFGVTANGWGPVEKDMSNGENQAGDGKTISIRGKTYAKGLGVHAISEVHLPVNNSCSAFVSDIGTDDENSGSVIFQVLGDGSKLFDSGLLTNQNQPQTANVNITGVKDIQLEVTDGGNGNSGDHADWAGAKVVCVGSNPSLIPSPSVSACQGADLDHDGGVSISDYNTLITNFNKSGAGDIDGDGKVTILDYNVLVTNFGKTGC